ncbi:response regulator transcription factor [Dyella lipolytica]|uniref:Response regulator transcription factor n=1 Tax=Dyella lipolytica TaxID=1867835 RepID=A0ABW8J0L3_9GAMM|nr:response regulator transcription factor [Dyella lipolytica]
MTRLLIADDHPLFRAALRQAASEHLDACDVLEASDLPGVLHALSTDPDIDLVLLDLHMPGSHGLSGLATLRGQHPGVAVLVVSAHDEPQVVRRVLDHGAAGFIPKSAAPGEISEAVAAVLNCGNWSPPALARSIAAPPSNPADADLTARLARLTQQQYRVLGLLAEGLMNKQIADRLSIQERTVKAHATAIFEKLEVRNRTQASVLLRSLDLSEAGRIPSFRAD